MSELRRDYSEWVVQTGESPDLERTVRDNIRAEAARRGVGQQALADALGVQKAAVSKRWTGVLPWRLGDLPIVAEVLGVAVSDLVTDWEWIRASRAPAGATWIPRQRIPRARRDSNPQPSVRESDVISITDFRAERQAAARAAG